MTLVSPASVDQVFPKIRVSLQMVNLAVEQQIGLTSHHGVWHQVRWTLYEGVEAVIRNFRL